MTASKETITQLLEVAAFKEFYEIMFTDYLPVNYVRKDPSLSIDEIVKAALPFSERYPVKTKFVSEDGVSLNIEDKRIGRLSSIQWNIQKVDMGPVGFASFLDRLNSHKELEPEEDLSHWFITPHDLRSSRTEKAIGFQSGRSGWSDYEED